jgi:hypothetical protein
VSRILRIVIFLVIISDVFFSCRKEEEITTDPSARLSFSTDTVWFDTVFAQSGTNQPLSVTKRLWVYNPNTNAVKVNISLKGNPWVKYKLNIDGQPSNAVSGKLIRGKDSIIIFVQMYVPDTTASIPFIVSDEIDFTTNGNQQAITISGYTKRAIYFRNQVLDCSSANLHWISGLPYVIYDSILIPRGCTLTIDAGTHIYSHVKSCILVSGTLVVNGTTGNPVIFEGDRMEPDYSDVPGQWIGIRILLDSKDNVIRNAVIKNGVIGVEVDSASLNENPKLLISQSIVRNMSADGILGYTADIVAINNLVVNCGQFSFLGAYGGNYHLYHNTFATFANIFARTTPTVVLDNSPYTDVNGKPVKAFPLNSDLTDNIIFGSQDDEFLLNSADGGDTTGKIVVQYCLLKSQKYATQLNANGNILNQDPLFNNYSKNDFDLPATSPAKGKGIYVNVPTDLKGRPRSSSTPTIGCYE